MGLQKVICLFAIIVSAVVFLYALGVMTDLYDTLYTTMTATYEATDDSVVYTISRSRVDGAIVYYNMQSFNQQLLLVSIVMILLGALLFVTNTHSRRKYYIGNYFATGIYAIAAVVTGVWSHIEIEKYKAEYLKVDFAALEEYLESRQIEYTNSTFWFDVHYLVLVLLVAAAALLIWNAVWKTNLMKQETQLLQNGAK